MSIEVLNESGVDVDERRLVELSRFVLDRLRIHPQADLSITVVDEATMTQLHEQWMDEPGPTDVLSFPMDELRPPRDHEEAPQEGILGDVVLCPAVAERQARAAGHSAEHELHLLTVHGILHLLGYDHAEPAEERVMFAQQDELLAAYESGAPAPGAGPS
jgi:probable rRNA maturation factor